jgi:hypothetical protein
MLDPLTVFLNFFAGTLLVAIVALLALGRHEGALSAIHWPRALLFAFVGSAGVGAVGMLMVSAIAWIAGWGGRG